MSLLSKNESYEQEYNKDNKEIQFTAQNNLNTTLLFQMKINELLNIIEQNRTAMAQEENKQELRLGGASLDDERSEEWRSTKPRGQGFGRSN